MQLFGNNRFALELVDSYPEGCQTFNEITILHTPDSLSIAESNHFNRVRYQSTQRGVVLVKDSIDFFRCIKNEEDLLLVNKEGIWGSYNLDREGVDRLLAELDVLITQKSYGEGTSR